MFVAVEVPWFGLRLSCFGHVRAKTNTEFPCGPELCPVSVWDLSPVVCLLHRDVKGGFAAGMQWLSPWDVLAWPICEALLNPAVLFCCLCPLAMYKPAIDPYSEGIMPSSGVAALLRD